MTGEGNGSAQTLPQALAAEYGRLEEFDRRQTAQKNELRTVKDLIIKLAHSVDQTREAQALTLKKVDALTSSVDMLNTSVRRVIDALLKTPPKAKPTPRGRK